MSAEFAGLLQADVARGVTQWWGPLLAFAAGVVSFVSPCVLPIVPGMGDPMPSYPGR